MDGSSASVPYGPQPPAAPSAGYTGEGNPSLSVYGPSVGEKRDRSESDQPGAKRAKASPSKVLFVR